MRTDRQLVFALSLFTLAWLCQPVPPVAAQSSTCDAYQAEKVPQDFDGCTAELEEAFRNPSKFKDPATGSFKLDEYEKVFSEYLGLYCYRQTESGWVPDKWLRDTGPYVSLLADGSWAPAKYYGTHPAVVIWYDKTMYDWLKANRSGHEVPAAGAPPVPDGAIMIKEMYTPPAARCASVKDKVHHLEPNGIAPMVRDQEMARDGWFWGYWAKGQVPDWPAPEGNPLPNLGFGEYCLNCHASAQDNQTFAGLQDIDGEPGWPVVYLSQNFLFEDSLVGGSPAAGHQAVGDTSDDAARHDTPLSQYSEDFRRWFQLEGDVPPPTPKTAGELFMPSQTYDHVWVPGPAEVDGEPVPVTPASEFLTSDQCIGCHDAGSTGLQFDMTAPSPQSGALLNLSPYATWQTSPMGLGGRDPIFFAQLESEARTFHPQFSDLIQDTCLGCHGITGQRQFKIDHGGDAQFLRRYANATPYPSDPQQNPLLDKAPYGGLARDGISCTSCHHAVLTEGDTEKNKDEKWNLGVAERQKTLAQDNNEGFAKTFTGSFFVGPPEELNGPFRDPRELPMEHALGITPRHTTSISNSGICGTCHTIYLPIFYAGPKDEDHPEGGYILGNTYEQTTYPEWAFSAYRTGSDPWKPNAELPDGAGPLAQSCQDCHMRSTDSAGKPFKSKIASIQEYSNFPATENTLGPDVDLPVREGFARHTLVGLNLFFVEMAKQFADVLGIRTQDPMMVSNGLDPVLLTEREMLEQASNSTASLDLVRVEKDDNTLKATLTVTNKVGHKFPSGVSFRRAFLEFSVLDATGRVLWASGRTNGVGVIVDEKGQPIAGELFWKPDCSGRIESLAHQPHYEKVMAQDQAQIYQELVVAPPQGRDPNTVKCGHDYTRGGLFTTSFLSICGHVKDNRLLPQGFLSLERRTEIAQHLGVADPGKLAESSGPSGGAAADPDYREGGGDSLEYVVDLTLLDGEPASVKATLYSQATPPFFLQDRFCTSQSQDTRRLYFLAGHLDLEDTRAEDWKLEVVSTGLVSLN